MPKTQELAQRLEMNLKSHSNWAQRINGADSSDNVLWTQYDLLLEGVDDKPTRLYISTALANERLSKIQAINEKNSESYMPTYEYWQNFANTLIGVCEKSERESVGELKNTPWD